VRFLFSDGSVDRVGDTIDPQGWQLDSFRKNAVCLWAHDALSPPIGRVSNVFVDHRGLIGDIRFAEAEVYEFADTIFRLVINGYLSAVSVGFLPLEYDLSNDRPYGVDFMRQELLEVSVCPVPANSNALVAASMRGVITDGEASMLRRLPIGSDEAGYRRRRLAELASARPRAGQRRIRAERLPPREVLRLNMAGPYAESDRKVDLLYPALAAQEVADARAAWQLADTPESRRALVVALGRIGRRH
jgi:HK97 family phage prohead protease